MRHVGHARYDAPDADADGQRGEPGPPPGEVCAFIREMGAAGCVLCLVDQAALTSLSLVRLKLCDGMRRVGELAEVTGDEVGDLLADVDGVIADPLDAA